MRRSYIYSLGIILLGSSAVAQQDISTRLRLKDQVRYAGIYHYATNTWTRPGSLPVPGPDFSVIYNNTCSSPYFAASYPGEYWTDEGRIPSTTSPDKVFSESQASTGSGFVGAVNECPAGPSSAHGSAAGSATSYTISGLQIGYCSMSAGSTTQIDLEFRQWTMLDGARCAESRATAPTPVATFSLTDFPGSAGNPYGCWVAVVDLSALGEFSMLADGTGSYKNPARSSELDHLFSWTYTFPDNPIPTPTAASGFFVQGNPANAAPLAPNGTIGLPNSNGWMVLDPGMSGPGAAASGYDGTVWDKHGRYPLPSMFNGNNNGSRDPLWDISEPFGNEDGTGMSTQDCVYIDNPTLNPLGAPSGSYWFGGPGVSPPLPGPFTSFHLELYTSDDTNFVSAPGTGFCYGDGCAFTCPCTVGTIPDPQGHHESGCSNSASFGVNIGSILTSSGSSNPFVGETVVLTCQVDHVFPLQSPLAVLVKGSARLENGAFPASNDGVRCVDGGLVRMGSHFVGANGNPAGTWQYPTSVGSETIPISIRSASTNSQNAWFQVFHRNTPNSFCFSDSLTGTNWSNGMIIHWGAP